LAYYLLIPPLYNVVSLIQQAQVPTQKPINFQHTPRWIVLTTKGYIKFVLLLITLCCCFSSYRLKQ